MKKSISLLIILCMLMACKHKESDSHEGHNHAEEAEEKEQATLYNEFDQLFVEFNEPVVGKESIFLAHYTSLKTFKPLESGKAHVEALKGGKTVYKSGLFHMERPGIYEGNLSISQEGNYELLFVMEYLNGKVSKHSLNEIVVHEHPHEEGHKHAHSGDDVTFLKEKAWDVGIEMFHVQNTDFNYSIKASGEIMPSRGSFEVITAKNTGILSFENTQMDNGTQIKKGMPLFRISGSGLLENNIDNEFIDIKANFEKSKANFHRKSVLYKERIVSARDYEEAKAQFESNQAKYNKLAKKYNTYGVLIRSTMQGHIYKLAVNDGDFVEEGQEIARIISSDKFRIAVDIPQNYFGILNDIFSVNFKSSYHDRVYSLKELNGKIISKGNIAERDSGFIPVIFEAESNVFIPGSFVECWVLSKKLNDKIVIPKSALIEEQGKYYVYVVEGGETYNKQEIHIKGDDGKNVMIDRGLKPGHWIVSKGAIYIKVASTAGAMPVHSH